MVTNAIDDGKGAIRQAVIKCRDRARIAERAVLDEASRIADEFCEDDVTIRLSNAYLTVEIIKPPAAVMERDAPPE